MGRITKADSKLYEEAQALLTRPGKLNPVEIRTVYENWTPLAEHNVGVGGIFFTPLEHAQSVAQHAIDGGRVLDLCAGIGGLSWALTSGYGNTKPFEIVALELSPAFCEIGQKLLPEVQWVNGSMFDLELLRSLGPFDHVISNPPFGRVPSAIDRKSRWLDSRGLPAHLVAVEVAARVADGATMILPSNDLPFSDSEGSQHVEHKPGSESWQRFHHLFPQIVIGATSINMDDDEIKWSGASPRVDLVKIECEDGELPLGLPGTLGSGALPLVLS